MTESVSDDGYGRLLRFRTGLRRFERWSEQQAKAAGLSAAQHQLLLAVRGHPDQRGPTVGEVSEYLMLRHHSAVELVNRAAAAGLVVRTSDPADRRLVRLLPTPYGRAVLGRLTETHLAELARLAPVYENLWEGLAPTNQVRGDQQGDS